MDIEAEMVANVWKVRVAEGELVADGDELIVLESMKMEIPVTAGTGGRVVGPVVSEGDVIQEGDLLLRVEPT